MHYDPGQLVIWMVLLPMSTWTKFFQLFDLEGHEEKPKRTSSTTPTTQSGSGGPHCCPNGQYGATNLAYELHGLGYKLPEP